MRLPMGHGTRSVGIRQFALVLAGIVAVTGCAPVSGPQDAGLVSASVPQRVVTQIVNNTCDDEEPQEESLSTGSVKGLSKVKNGFGIPYDEYAQEYVCPPVPVTDDSYEANKNRGIGYAGIEDHYAGALAPGQTHSPDHPEHEDVGAFDALRDLTTNEEKYGCCMRWEYAGWVGGPTGHSVSGDVGVDGYLGFLNGNGSGHKQYIAIHALKTDKWVICCPYDYGPATELSVSGSGKYGRIGGVSPQAAEDLGLGGGDCPDENLTEWWWVENSSQVECGPVSDLSRLTTGNESPSPAPSNTATVSTRVSTGLAGTIASQGVISDSQQVSVAPANANSFVQATDPAWCHGDLPRSAIRYVVFQDTNTGTEDAIGTLTRWRDVGFQSVPHFIVGRDGTITQCVPLDRIAHHAGFAPAGANAEFGVSPERDDTPPDGLTDSAMDAWSVGIALVHERDDGEYPKAQLDALDRLVAYVREQSEAKEPPILITKGEWRDGKRLGKQSEGDMVENTEDADAVESPEALMRAQARAAQDPEGQTEQVVAPVSENSVPQSEIDAMGPSVTSEFPTEEYASSENHSGTTTMGDVRVARESGECSDEENAEANPDAGGTGIAKKAVALSGTATPRGYITGKWDEVPTDGRLSDYVNEKRRVYPDVPGWADCGRFAATCVKASGADESFPAHMDTAYQYAYMTKTPKWNRVGTLRPGDSPDSLCRPGDVLVTEGKGHIMIYVGNDAVREKYPDSEANMAEASMGAYYGWCYRSVALSGTKAYAIFRCSNPDNATMGEGSPVSGLQGVVVKAKEFLGRPYYSVRDWRLSTYKDPNCPKTDCSGLVLWAYYQALGVDIVKQGGGSGTLEFIQRRNNGKVWKEITRDQLVPGDIILMWLEAPPNGSRHTIIYCGKDESGKDICIHEDGKKCSEIEMSAVLRWACSPQLVYYAHYVGATGTAPSTASPAASPSQKKGSPSRLTTSGATGRSSPWVETDEQYLKEMIGKAERYGSDTGWFCCVDASVNTSYGPRATVLHKVSGKWRVELGTDCIVGIRAQDSAERGLPWDSPRSRSFKGVWAIQYQTAAINACNRYTSCYVVSYDPSIDAPHNHDCQCFETQGFGDPRTLPKERRFRCAGCCGLRDADAKYIYQHCPLGTPVCVFDEEDPNPEDMRAGAVIDQANSDNGGVIAGDSSVSEGDDGESLGHVNVEVTRT